MTEFLLDNKTIPVEKGEMSKQDMIFELVNSKIENSTEAVETTIEIARSILGDEFATEQEKEKASRLSSKVVSLGFFLKDKLDNLVRMGLIAGTMIINPLNLFADFSKDRTKDKYNLENYKCISNEDEYVGSAGSIISQICWGLKSELEKIKDLEVPPNESNVRGVDKEYLEHLKSSKMNQDDFIVYKEQLPLIIKIFEEYLESNENDDVRNKLLIQKLSAVGYAGLDSIKFLFDYDKSHLQELRSIGGAKKQRVLENINSGAYLSRLEKEGFTNDQLKEEQKIRLGNVKAANFSIKDVVDFKGNGVNGLFNFNQCKKSFGVFIDSNSLRHENILREKGDNDILGYTAEHELTHAAVFSDHRISKRAQNILKTTFVFDENAIQKSIASISSFEIDIDRNFKKYHSSVAERYARKKTLDIEMEDLGIKKYEDDFTEEHYKKLLEHYKNNKLSIQSMIFLMTTKGFMKESEEGFESLKEIFDEIALNESDIDKNLA